MKQLFTLFLLFSSLFVATMVTAMVETHPDIVQDTCQKCSAGDPNAPETHPDIVQDTCQKCSAGDPNANYTLCMSSFDSVPKSHHANLQGLGAIAAELAAANAKLVRSNVKALLASRPEDPYLKSCLKTCLELYTDSIASLKGSVKAIRAEQYDNANIMISAAVDAPGECEDGFSEGGIVSPLMEENREFFEHAVLALDVTAMLQRRGVS